MQSDRKAQAMISVQATGWTGVGAPLVRVLVDNVSVGILKDKQANRFPIPVGQHRVQVRRDFMKSEVLALELRAGQCADLECGYHRKRPSHRLYVVRTVAIMVCIASAVAVPALRLPFWSVYVLGGVGAVALGAVWWRSYIPAGSFLYLTRAGTSDATATRGTASRRPGRSV
jgi:hypothetical protein